MNSWQSYEETTAYIYQKLGEQNNLKIICYGNSCTISSLSYVGKPVKHQIDVLTEISDGIHRYKTAIECKHWNKKVTKDTVMKLKSIIDDCGISKGVIVSKMGFTPDAQEIAKKNSIELLILREPSRGDIPKDMIPQMTIALITSEPKYKTAMTIQPPITDIKKLTSHNTYIEYPDFTKEVMFEFIQKESNKYPFKTGEDIEAIINFEKGTKILYDTKEHYIEKIKIKFYEIEVVVTNSDIHIDILDSFVATLYDLFTDKTFILDASGNVSNIAKD